MNSIRLSFLALGAVLLALVFPAGCGLSQETNTVVDGGGKPCANDSECDEGNACIVPVCDGLGVCNNHPLMGDPPDDKAGDCMKPVCDGDVVKHVADSGDPEDDGNPCTVDKCEANGKTSHTAEADGMTCSFHGNDGKCDKGECSVPCSDNKPCTSDSKCTLDFCDPKTNHCAFTLLDGVSVPGEPPVAGDCQQVLCKMGDVDKEVDNTDIPKPKGICFTPSCDAGKPKQTPKPVNTKCSDGSGDTVCDTEGECVACTEDSQCPKNPNPCILPNCTSAHKCGFKNAANGTSPSGLTQIPSDCHKVVCDGNAHQKTVVDTTDPKSDGNECTKDTCSATGTFLYPPETNGTPCSGGNLQCEGGACTGCQHDNQCNGTYPNGTCDLMSGNCICTPSTCASLGATCGSPSDGCGNNLPCNDLIHDGQEGGVDCGITVVTACGLCGKGTLCSGDSDCGTGHCADSVCCDMACGGCNACTAAIKGGGVDGTCGPVPSGGGSRGACSDQGAAGCDNDGLCNGLGGCQDYPSGTACGTTCSSSTLTQDQCNGSGSCGAQGSGSCPGHLTCQDGTSCKGNCTGDGDCVSGYYCNSGSCAQVQGNGASCGSDGGACSSGHCVDGVCCGSASCSTCSTCNGTSPGTCSAITSGQDPPGCVSPSSCVAGACVTPPACTDATCPVCQVCNAGHTACVNDGDDSTEAGRCDNTAAGNPAPNCHGGTTHTCQCDGTGTVAGCKRVSGQPCGSDAECLSGGCNSGNNQCN